MRLALSAAIGVLALCAHASAALAEPDFSARTLIERVGALPAPRAGIGGPAEVANLRACEEWVLAELRAMGFEPETVGVPWQPRRAMTRGIPGGDEPIDPPLRNIFVTVPGDGELSREVVVVGAHTDTVPGSIGADDNATGVVALLEIARAALEPAPGPRRTLRLAFYTLEEVGLVGSRQDAAAYLPELHDAGGRVVAMLSLDMLGYYSTEPGSQLLPIDPIPGVFEHDGVGDDVTLVTSAAARPMTGALAAAMEAERARIEDGGGVAPGVFRFDFSPVPLPDVMRSDHAGFLLAGVPAAMVTDTANFRNPHYHRASDTVETIDAARYASAARMLIAGVDALRDPERYTAE